MNRRETLAKTNRSASLNLGNLGAIHDIIKNLIKIDTEERIDTSQEKLKGYYKQQKQLNRRMSRLQMERRAELAAMRRKTLDESSLQQSTSSMMLADAAEEVQPLQVVMDDDLTTCIPSSPTMESPILARKVSVDLGFESGFETENDEMNTSKDEMSDSSDSEKLESQLSAIPEDVHDSYESRETGISSSTIKLSNTFEQHRGNLLVEVEEPVHECRSLVVEQEPDEPSSLPAQTVDSDCDVSFIAFNNDDVAKIADQFVYPIRVENVLLSLTCKACPPSNNKPVKKNGIQKLVKTKEKEPNKKAETNILKVKILKYESENAGLTKIMAEPMKTKLDEAKLRCTEISENKDISDSKKVASTQRTQGISSSEATESENKPTNEAEKKRVETKTLQADLKQISIVENELYSNDKENQASNKSISKVNRQDQGEIIKLNKVINDKTKIISKETDKSKDKPKLHKAKADCKSTFEEKKLAPKTTTELKPIVKTVDKPNQVSNLKNSSKMSLPVSPDENTFKKSDTDDKIDNSILHLNKPLEQKKHKINEPAELSAKQNCDVSVASTEQEYPTSSCSADLENDVKTKNDVTYQMKIIDNITTEKIVELISESCNQGLSRFVQCKAPTQLSEPKVVNLDKKQEEKARQLKATQKSQRQLAGNHKNSTFFLFDVLLRETKRDIAFQFAAKNEAGKTLQKHNNVNDCFRISLKSIHKPHPAQRSYTVDIGQLMRPTKKWKPRWRRNK